MTDVYRFLKFGKESHRVSNIADYQVIFIGIESIDFKINSLAKQAEAQFEVRTRLVRSSDEDLLEKYMIEDSTK